jgi:hypothetical protein
MADFGLDTGGNVVIQKPATSQGPATQITGGDSGGFSSFGSTPQAPRADFSGAAESTAATLGALNKLTEGLLAPQIAAAQKRQYFDGMSQVVQGKSLLQIEKEQPWYTKLFGPSATVQGAQAMTLTSKLDDAQADWIAQMPQLRQLPPDAARKYLVDQATQIANTGDPTMDAMVQAKLAEQWGPMLDLHMKQHITYVQEQNVNAFGNSLVSAGSAYQQKLGNTGFYTPEQIQLEKARATDAFKPIPGMTDDAWSKATTQALQANLMQGNFGIYEAFKETPEYSKLPLDARTQLERLQPFATQWVQRNLPQFRDDASNQAALHVALTQGTGPQSLEQLQAYMDRQDKQWMAKSGSTTPFYDNAERARMEQFWYQGQEYLRRQQAAAAAAQGKLEQQVANDNFQRQSVMESLNGGAHAPVAMDKLDPTVVQQTLRDARSELEKAGDVNGLKVWLGKLAVGSTFGSKLVDQDLSNSLTVAANNFFTQGTPVTDDMRKSLGYMQMLAASKNGTAALSTYIGGANAAKMTALVQSGVDLSDKSAVDAARISIANGWNADVTTKDLKEVQTYIDSQDPGFLKRNIAIFGPGALSGYDLNDDSKRRMAQDLAPTVARMVRGMGMSYEDAMPIAFSQVYGNTSDVDFIDGAYVPASPTSRGAGLFATVAGKVGGMSQLSEDYQQATRNVINNAMSAAIGRQPIPPADKRVNVAGRTMNGLLSSIPFVGDELPQPFSENGLAPDPAKFDPDDYKTVAGLALGGGVVQVTRVPKSNTSGSRPVTVTITADQVIKELDAIRKKAVDRSRPRGVLTPFEQEGQMYQQMFGK